MFRRPHRAALWGLLLWPLACHGGRPFVTDDAGLTTPQTCQLQGWHQELRAGDRGFLIPTCNPGENLSFTLGFTRGYAESDPPTDLILQLKTRLREIPAEGFGVALALGGRLRSDPEGGAERLASLFLNLPLTRHLDHGGSLHSNFGWRHDRDRDRGYFTWGLGAESAARAGFSLFAETYGEGAERPFFQTGGIWTRGDGHLKLYLSAGAQTGDWSQTRYVSLGFNFYRIPWPD